ncbi:MAG: insulinase family protein [Oscillospiraceae bacterium]|nr:insulinase family protein [Oscillospiraceae bacterium]
MNKFEYPRLGESMYRTVLANGLTVAVVPRPGFSRKLMYFATDFGSIHTDFQLDGQQYHVPAGVAHFLEHKMFDLPGGRDVTAELAGLGAGVNAFTSFDITAYFVACTDNFQQCLKLLLEFVSTPYFTEESVRKEMGIIDQEIGMNLDSPDSRVFEDVMVNLFHRHPIRVPILGTSETIRQITPEILYTCHRAFYTPGNMILCVVGDVDPDRVAAIAEEVLGTEKRSVGRKLRDWNEDMTVASPESRRTMEVSMPTFQLGFKCEDAGWGRESVRKEVVGDLAAEALFGESSELYLRLYEDGLIDSSFGGGFETSEGVSMLFCGGDSDEPEAVRDAILAAAAELAKTGVDEASFLRMKRSALGRRIRDLDSFDSTCFRVCAHHMSRFEYFDFPGVYEEVTAEELREFIATCLTPERMSMSVIVPKEEA